MVSKEISSYIKYAFFIGFIVAVIAGIIPYGDDTRLVRIIISIFLAVFGIAAGLFSVSRENETSFLISVITLLVGGAAALTAFPSGLDIVQGYSVRMVLANLGVLLGPVAVIVALKNIFKAIV